ncbi:MAG: CBS domain-containing protein [Myxococcales bacterium]
MHQHGISHLPVIDAGRLVGGIDESGLVRLLRDGAVAGAASARTVGEVMGRPAPQVDACADVAEVSRLLLVGHPLVVVSREGALAGVLTCSDLVSFWTRPKEVTP